MASAPAPCVKAAHRGPAARPGAGTCVCGRAPFPGQLPSPTAAGADAAVVSLWVCVETPSEEAPPADWGFAGWGISHSGRRPDAGVRSENPQTSRQETGAAGESPSFKRQRAPDSARLKPGFSGDRNDRDEGSVHGEGGREAG